MLNKGVRGSRKNDLNIKPNHLEPTILVCFTSFPNRPPWPKDHKERMVAKRRYYREVVRPSVLNGWRMESPF